MVKKCFHILTFNIGKNLTFLLIFFMFFLSHKSKSQETKPIVEIGENTIKLNEPFVITVVVKNQENRPICKFPEINNFKKRAISYAIATSNQNGKSITDQRVSQEYFPNKAGSFTYTNLNIQVNDIVVAAPNFSVTVLVSEIDETEANFKDFIDGSAYEFVDVKDDAFFAITTNKLRPYVGEGFLATIAFYIAQTNKAEMDFVNVNGQLDGILKQFRPKNCWEENLGISEIKVNKLIKIGNKKYFQYKIYQAIYYPFNNQPIQIPALKWQMLKYKIAKDQEVSQSKKEDFKTYFSKPIFIKPQPLPQNNNFETNFVGDFKLVEQLDKDKVQTGRTFNYTFKVQGDGNLALLKFPETLSDSLFEIYEPTVNQQFSNIMGKLIPEKTFHFNIVPKFAGKFSLKNHFFINYFNVHTRKYETLRAEKEIVVVGSNIKIESEPVTQDSDIFQNLENLNSADTSFDYRNILNQFSNFLIWAMLASMLYIIWPSKK